ncbi:MAG: TadE/TadG family type IV pilus assembly protein [Pseudomonadota bacterium]
MFRDFLRDDRGAATVEFAIIFPILFAVVAAFLEMGWVMTRQMMLDRGVDVTMRDVRIGRVPNITHDMIKEAICANAYVITSCEDSLKVQLIPYSTATPADFASADCYDRNLDPSDPINVSNGFSNLGINRDEIIFVRACVLVDFLLPGAGLGFLLAQRTPENGYAMVSYSAYQNEPS